MRKRLFNQQTEPGAREAQKPQRLSVKAKIMMALFALMLIPQGMWALDYFKYNTTTKQFEKVTITSGYTDLLTLSKTSWIAETIVVSGDVSFSSDRIDVHGEVNLILCDGAKLEAQKGITVPSDAILNIYAQEKGTGQLEAYGYSYDSSTGSGTGYYYGAAIGGYDDTNVTGGGAGSATCGTIVIHGGIITANSNTISGTSVDPAAGIGGCNSDGPLDLTIYGGKVTATGGKFGAGIGGGGGLSSNGGSVSIYGGEVIANGGAGDASTNKAMGIGRGSYTGSTPGSNGTLTLGTNVVYYGGASSNPTTVITDDTRYQYMKTDFTYPLSVNGNPVKASNASDILGAVATPTASFYPSTNTLSLNGVSISRNISSDLPNLTVRFAGTNKINTGGTDNNAILSNYASGGTLTFVKGGDGTLELNGNSDTAVKGFASVIYGDGCYLKSDEPTKYSSDYKRYINFANGNAPVYVVTITSDVCYPLWIGTSTTNATQVATTTITAGVSEGTVTFTPATGTTSSKLSLSGAKLNAKILSLLGDLIIDVSGTNTITSPDSGTVIRSANEGNLTLEKAASNSSLELKTNLTDNTKPVIQGFHTLSYSGFDLNTSAMTPTYGIFNSMYGLYDDGPEGKTAILSATFAETTEYQLWVSGTQVTSANQAHVLGSTAISFDATTNTLTLNGTYNADIKTGLANLTVNLVGNVSFYSGSKYVFEGVTGNEKITFTTDASNPGHYDVNAAYGIFNNISTDNVTYQNGLIYWDKNTNHYTYVGCCIRVSPWQGSGTSGDPYQIGAPGDLKQLSEDVNGDFKIDQHFIVTADLDCSSLSFTSIGKKIANNQTDSFDGTFDGNGKTISNLTSQFGLFNKFGYNKTATVKNVKFSNCTVTGGGSGAECAGAVVGEMFGSSTIDNCEVTGGTISGGTNANVGFVGGIVGDVRSGTVSNCTVNNVAVSLSDASRGFRQTVGGIVGLLQGTVSGCQVMGTTTISNATSGTNDLYTGAIVGQLSSANLSNNTYESSVIVIQNTVTKSDNVQRGTGQDDGNGNYDVFDDGAVLAGVKKMTLSVNADGGSATVSGYYRAVGSDYYSLPTCSLTVKGTPNADYDIPALTLTDPSTNTDYTPGIPSGGADTESLSWSFPMPSVDLSGQMDFKIRLNKLGRVFTIDDFTYNGSGQGVTQIKTKKTSTSTNEITLSLTNGDVSFVDYMNSNGETLAPSYNQANPPSAAGDYKISITAGNKTTGSCEVAYKINAATATITAGDQKVTYTRAGQAYSGVTNCPGSYSVTYYPTEADRTNNSNGYTTPLPVNAGDYFVRVTQTDPNYTSSPVDAKFTIEAIEAQFTWGTTQFDYDGNPHVPTASVSNIVDGDACSVTVSGQQTNAGSSYTATISGLGSTNYKLPATAPSKTFSINPIAVGLNWTNTVFTFDGDAHKPTATATGLKGSDVCNVTVTGEQTNASETSYTATATALDNNNYKLPTTGLTQDFTISPCSLATATIATIDAQTYSGSEIEPTPGVKIILGKSTTETQLDAGTDFDYSYSNNMNAALSTDTPAPTVTITGKGNYKGMRVVKFTIDPLTATLAWSNTSFTYDGTSHVPTATVSNLKGTDACTVTVTGAQTDASTTPYTATATALSNTNYTLPASATQTFTIGKIVAALSWSGTAFTYDGAAHVPTATVTNLQGTDACTVTVTGEQTNASTTPYTATATALSNANYILPTTVTQTFTIDPREVTLTWGVASFDYDGTAHAPIAVVSNLAVASDACSVSVSGEQTNASTTPYTATASGVGNSNYKLPTPAPTKTFTINPLTATLSWTNTSFTYDGAAHLPTATVTNLIGTDACTVTVTGEQTNASATAYTATATALSNTNYALPTTVTQTFTIDPVDLLTSAAITIDAVSDQIYTGSAIEPTPEVKFNGNKLVAGTDFNYSYSNNTDAAQSSDTPAPTVTITGMGNFTNSVPVKFTIVDRVASVTFGSGRYFKTFFDANESFRVPDNVTAYVVTGVSGNTVTLRRVFYIQANNAVLMESTPGVTTAVNLSETYGDNYLKGVTSASGVNAAEKNYILYNDEFVRATGTIPAGKVYLDLSTYVSPVRTLVISRGNTTAIDEFPSEEADGDEWFDMQGRKINKPTKAGLYIKNGKKVVVKNK